MLVSLTTYRLSCFAGCIFSLCLVTDAFSQAQADKLDAQRSSRYVGQLQTLQESRIKMRDRASSLLAQNPSMEQELWDAMRVELTAAGALRATPRLTATPQLLQSFQVYRGQSGELILQPQLLVWYAFQDNTLVRQQLFLQIAAARQDAAQTHLALQSSLVALQQLADNSDQNFLEFRQLGDALGRRSNMELSQAESLTAGWTNDDPLHAGATLVRAYALRSMGRFDECMKLLELLDNNYPAMQSIANSVAAQIAYVSGNIDDARRLLDKGIAQARDTGTSEAYVTYGWIALAESKFSEAKNHASKARQLNPGLVEVAILEALATAYEKPTRARDALQLLRRAQLNTTPDDWHYHEALAIIHKLAHDHQYANREIATALKSAPTHIRAELEREQQELQGNNVPNINWQARLVMQWLR